MIEPHRTSDEPISLREAALPGLIAGVIGGLVMGVILMFFAARQGDPFQPMKLIAATVLGENALSDITLKPVLLGGILHFTAAIAIGIFFAWLGGYITVTAATVWGVIFGLATWVIMQYGILPVINPYLAETSDSVFALAHAAFGVSLGTYPRFLAPPRAVPQVQRKAA